MKLNKKVVESAAVLAFAGLLSVTAVTNSEITVAEANVPLASEASVEETVIANTSSLEDEGIAGVTATLYVYQEKAAEQLVTVESVETELVSASEEETEIGNASISDRDALEYETEETVEEMEVDATAQEWSDKLMAQVDEFLYVRESDDEDASIIGKMYKGDRALILEQGDEWTKIESGKVIGYVKNQYCVMGDDAYEYAKENCGLIATVAIDGLRIRDGQSEDASVITALASGEKLKVVKNAETEAGWLAVIYESETRYVSEQYVTLSYDTGKAITLEDENAAILAAEQEKEAANNSTSNSSNNSSSSRKDGAKKKQGSAVPAGTDDETLLAALIQCEAGGCSYDCQLAVGAVVVNRVKSRSYPNTVYKVIYQRGQFGPASSGKLASRVKAGVSSTARKAARAALSGIDNTNGAKAFKLASSGHKGVKYGPIVFY